MFIRPSWTTQTDSHLLMYLPRKLEALDDNELWIICNKKEFDNKLKSHLLEKLSSTIVCDRLFCHVCSTIVVPYLVISHLHKFVCCNLVVQYWLCSHYISSLALSLNASILLGFPPSILHRPHLPFGHDLKYNKFLIWIVALPLGTRLKYSLYYTWVSTGKSHR
jgi:hypothetical protein